MCEVNLHFTQRSGQAAEIFFQESVKPTVKDLFEMVSNLILFLSPNSQRHCLEFFSSKNDNLENGWLFSSKTND